MIANVMAGALILAVVIAAGAALTALNVDVTPQDVDRALTIARSMDRDRARFHAPYIKTLSAPEVETVEVISEFRRYVLTAEDRGRKGDRMFGYSVTLAQQAVGPWKNRLAIVARLRFHPQNNYVTAPPAEIGLDGYEHARVGVLNEPVMAFPSGQPGERIAVLGAVVESVWEAIPLGQGVREFVIRLHGRELARVSFDLSKLE